MSAPVHGAGPFQHRNRASIIRGRARPNADSSGPAGSVSALLRGGAAPASAAQLAVRPVPLGAALGTPPRGEVSTAPRPHVSPQGLPVPRMRRPVSVLCVRLTAPARFAAQTIGPVAGGAAHHTQPRGAVALASAAATSRQRAPRAVADGWINRGAADRGRRHPASQAHRPRHATVEPTAADHARFNGRRIGQFRIPVHGHRVPAPAIVPFRQGAALGVAAPAWTDRRRKPRTTYGPAAADTSRTEYRDQQPAGPRSVAVRRQG